MLTYPIYHMITQSPLYKLKKYPSVVKSSIISIVDEHAICMLGGISVGVVGKWCVEGG